MAGVEIKTVKVDDLRTFMQGLLKATGCDEETAATVANVFLEANLRGIPVQGLNHLNGMLGKLRKGFIDAAGKPEVADEGDGYAVVNGHKGPGQVAGLFAADLAVRKARESGCCTVGIVDSQDIYMLAYYVEKIARNGMVGMLFSDATPAVHPTGGIEKVLGTNPLAMSSPTAGDDPVVLDMATSATLMTHIRQAAARDEPIPAGVAIDKDGNPTTDAKEALEGALSPLGGHKGYGLGLAVALLSGALVGCDMGKALMSDPGPPGRKGHLLIAIDPAAFGELETFKKAVSAYIKEIKDSKKAPGVTEILVPGERSFRERARALKEGTVGIEADVWEQAAGIAGELGVEVPA